MAYDAEKDFAERTALYAAKGIPAYMAPGLARWVVFGAPTGGFLGAVLANNLKDAVARADDNNVRLLPVYVSVLYNYAPADCSGSFEKAEAWAKGGGLEGVMLRAKAEFDRRPLPPGGLSDA